MIPTVSRHTRCSLVIMWLNDPPTSRRGNQYKRQPVEGWLLSKVWMWCLEIDKVYIYVKLTYNNVFIKKLRALKSLIRVSMKNFDGEICSSFKHEKQSWSEIKSRLWKAKSEKFTDDTNPSSTVQIKVTDLKIKSGTERNLLYLRTFDERRSSSILCLTTFCNFCVKCQKLRTLLKLNRVNLDFNESFDLYAYLQTPSVMLKCK